MGDAFKESNTKVYRNIVTFVTGFGIIADQNFQVGSEITINSNLVTYNTILPWGGISGYLSSGYSDTFLVHKINDESVTGVKTFVQNIITPIIKSVSDNTQAINLNSGIITFPVFGLPQTSINWTGGTLHQPNIFNELTLDWGSRILTGFWKAQNLDVYSGLSISGQSVITGGSFYGLNNSSGYITSGQYLTPTQFYTGNSTGSLNQFTLDWASGNVLFYTMTGSTKFNFTNDRDGQTIVFGLGNSGNGLYTGIWPTNIRWPFTFSTPPLQTTGATGYVDIYTFIKAGRNIIFGNVVQGFSGLNY